MLGNWDSAFPHFEPVGYKLRHCFPNRWVRFHSLPESQRYPGKEAEFDILLARHNAVLSELIHPSKQVVLLTTEFSDTENPLAAPKESPSAKWWQSVRLEECYWHIYASELIWQPQFFSPIIRRVAVDEPLSVMICDSRCDWVVHPYDGGMDVVLSTTERRDCLRTKYQGWLSSPKSGL